MRTALVLALLAADICRATLTVGQPLPAIELTDVDGRLFSSSDLDGHPMLVTVFDGTCNDCEQVFQRLSLIEKTGAVEVILVNVDGIEIATRRSMSTSLKRPVYFPNTAREKFLKALFLKVKDLPYAYTTDSQHILTSAAPARDLSAEFATSELSPGGTAMPQASGEQVPLDPATSELEEKRLLAILEQQPEDHETHHALGKLYDGRADEAHALSHYMAALENGPKGEFLHYANHVIRTVRQIQEERDDYQTYLTASGMRLQAGYLEEELNQAIEMIKRIMAKYGPN